MSGASIIREIEWQPAELIKSTSQSKYALIVLNQPLENVKLFEQVWKQAGIRIAADGGANRVDYMSKNSHLGWSMQQIKLDVICGDLDSIDASVLEQAKQKGTLVSEETDQYSTDFTKSYKYARKHSPRSDVVVLGGLGGRVDQALATLNHLYLFQESPDYANGKVYLVSSEAITFVLKQGRHRIRVKDGGEGAPGVLGRNVGIIPKLSCTISTQGLEWDVKEWRTEWGGQISTSNYVREEWVTIETTGDVLFTIDYAL